MTVVCNFATFLRTFKPKLNNFEVPKEGACILATQPTFKSIHLTPVQWLWRTFRYPAFWKANQSQMKCYLKHVSSNLARLYLHVVWLVPHCYVIALMSHTIDWPSWMVGPSVSFLATINYFDALQRWIVMFSMCRFAYFSHCGITLWLVKSLSVVQ